MDSLLLSRARTQRALHCRSTQTTRRSTTLTLRTRMELAGWQAHRRRLWRCVRRGRGMRIIPRAFILSRYIVQHLDIYIFAFFFVSTGHGQLTRVIYIYIYRTRYIRKMAQLSSATYTSRGPSITSSACGASHISRTPFSPQRDPATSQHKAART